MNKRDYRPVSCELHSRYELAIMHRQRLRLSWQDENGQPVEAEVLPLDIQTRDGAEYLRVRYGKETRAIRLDQIKTSKGTST